MNRKDGLDCFQFQNDFFLNNEVNLVTASEAQPLVGDRQVNLPLE